MKEAGICGPGAPGEPGGSEVLRPPGLLALPSCPASHVAPIGDDALISGIAEHGLRLPHFDALRRP